MRVPDFLGMCAQADYAPGVWGHKCTKPKHPRTEEHHCQCGHEWKEPTDPDAH